MKSGLAQWLGTHDGREVLNCCVADISAKARRASIELSRIFIADFADDQAELFQVISSELKLYLLEHQTAVIADVSDDASCGDISAVSAKISTRFINHLLDKRRTYSVNPFHAYLRHMRKVISRAENIQYVPTEDGSYFAYSEDETIAFLPHSFWGHLFTGWASPPVPHEEIEGQAGMLSLSRFYWNEATCRYEAEYLHPLLELARFVFAKYSFAAQRQEIGSDDGVDGTGFIPLDQLKPVQLVGDPLGSLTRQSERLDYDIIETQLSDLAEKCAAGLEETKKEVLLLTAAGHNLSEIATMVGETRYIVEKHLKAAQAKIRHFWSLWGNAQLPGFTEEDEEEQLIFIEKIVQICKTYHGGRAGI